MIFWLIGTVFALIAIVFVWEEVEIDPFSNVSCFLPALGGFAVFPVINYCVAIIALIMVAYERTKRKARKEGKIE